MVATVPGMAKKPRIPHRGGRRGESHRATPTLPSYDVPPASDVTVTRADGTTETVGAKQARVTAQPARQRGPLVCAFCGYPIEGRVSRGERGAKGKPVHADGCPPQEAPKRPTKPDPASTQPRARGGSGNPYKSRNAKAVSPEWALKVTCPRCRAVPGNPCQKVNSEGLLVVVADLHQERAQMVRRVMAEAQQQNRAAGGTEAGARKGL